MRIAKFAHQNFSTRFINKRWNMRQAGWTQTDRALPKLVKRIQFKFLRCFSRIKRAQLFANLFQSCAKPHVVANGRFRHNPPPPASTSRRYDTTRNVDANSSPEIAAKTPALAFAKKSDSPSLRRD